ncbi:hypothetical protein BGZ61DRAFT_483975 [Ilyonectria robusta]|uniref:uncharacterized protein n=1 Tax=Ilyonectria robusta TaxID=1079257 RepID=UPI001E8D94F2|nr:uncharacterized protein BGZ61DRAFT_483975 [Ilyonectria robusta]KAH8667291.1 hypothetical protein BGZ61DRAFT_483975 [Ilyonectria robusta]
MGPRLACLSALPCLALPVLRKDTAPRIPTAPGYGSGSWSRDIGRPRLSNLQSPIPNLQGQEDLAWPMVPSPASRSGPARRPIPKTTSHVDLPSTGPINPLDSPVDGGHTPRPPSTGSAVTGYSPALSPGTARGDPASRKSRRLGPGSVSPTVTGSIETLGLHRAAGSGQRMDPCTPPSTVRAEAGENESKTRADGKLRARVPPPFLSRV